MNQVKSALIVDDTASARAVLRDMLTELGFAHIHEASDGRQAAEFLATTTVDIVLCDQIMTDMSGQMLLAHLRADGRLATLPVIMVSALSNISDVDAALETGATDYLVKPVSFRKLRRKVEDALYGSTEQIELEPAQFDFLTS
jgi:two-component system chemotaxis response regulator CheY